MSMTNMMEEKIIKHIAGVETFVKPEKYYLGLCTSTNDDGTSVEISAEEYKRAEVSFKLSSAGCMVNENNVVFEEAKSDWPYINRIGIYDAETGGNLLFYATISLSLVKKGTQIVFKPERIEFYVD